MRHLPAHDYRRVRWKNGLGWTTEIAVGTGEGLWDWDWRISIATVDADSEFSSFPGIDRSLLVLDGAGMVLSVEGQGTFTLLADGPPLAFSGDVSTSSRLLAGPTRDFNVMTRRGVVSHTLSRHTLAGSLVLGHATTLVYSIEGDARIVENQELRLEPGDSVVLDDQRGATLTGDAKLVLVELLAATGRPADRAAQLPR
jgi:environmental stress-induced protein Ves